MQSLLYPTKPLAPRTRTKPMRVLALGLSRSGTDSLRSALQRLGYGHVYHGFDVGPNGDAVERRAWAELGDRKWLHGHDLTRQDLDVVLGHCEAVTDQPCACFALELIAAYPEAQVILNFRDPESWYTSVINTFGVLMDSFFFRYLSYFETSLYWHKRCFDMYDRHFFQGSLRRNAKRVQREHYAMIRGSVPAEKLLEWKVEDGWGPLCAFLGKDVPDVEFPRGNTPEDLRKRGAAYNRHPRRQAWINIGVVTASSVAVVALVAHRLVRWRGLVL